MIESYPLYWPEGWKRTPPGRRVPSQFKKPMVVVRDFLLDEIRRLGGREVIISTNIPVRIDGLFYASAREPEDPGVAVYFKYQGKQMSFACDQYRRVRENVQAIAMTIDALRGIERWGASDMMERAFRGFAALPDPTRRQWRDILGFGPGVRPSVDDVDSAFRELAKVHHPDRGGDATAFDMLVKAREEARRELSQ